MRFRLAVCGLCALTVVTAFLLAATLMLLFDPSLADRMASLLGPDTLSKLVRYLY